MLRRMWGSGEGNEVAQVTGANSCGLWGGVGGLETGQPGEYQDRLGRNRFGGESRRYIIMFM